MAAKKKQPSGEKNITGALAKIGEAITSDLYLEDILKLIVSVTAEVMGSKIVSLLLLDKEKKELAVKATQSVSERYNKKPNIKFGSGIAGKVAETRKPVTVSDVRKDSRYANREVAVKEKLCSLLCVPLMLKDEVIGVLNCYTAKPHQFTQNEINILKSIANQAAIVIDNFRLIVETKVIREELESRKIIEKAKGILMEQDKVSEEAAYHRMRKFSMDNRKNMREVAEAIVLNEEMRRAQGGR